MLGDETPLCAKAPPSPFRSEGLKKIFPCFEVALRRFRHEHQSESDPLDSIGDTRPERPEINELFSIARSLVRIGTRAGELERLRDLH